MKNAHENEKGFYNSFDIAPLSAKLCRSFAKFKILIKDKTGTIKHYHEGLISTASYK